MREAARIVCFVGTALAVGCVSQVSTNMTYDNTVNFTTYKTFAQAPAPTYAENMPGYSEITGRKIQQRIAYDLEQKGLEPASAEEADLQVTFSLGGQPRQDTEYWGGWGWYGPGTVETTNYVQGSLVIDIVDRAQKKLVWHGYGTENVFSQGGEEQLLFKAVDAVMAKYPPPVAGTSN